MTINRKSVNREAEPEVRLAYPGLLHVWGLGLMGKLTHLAPPVAMATLRTVAPAAASVGSAGATTGWAHRQGSAASRGYDAAWRKVRLIVLDGEPLCRSCAEHGQVTQATQVHHIEGFTSLKDPRRLALWNLAPVCAPCHAKASQRQAMGQG